MTRSETCPRCGEPAGGAFCSACGARTESAPCPSCGEEAAPGERFCTRCGSALAAGAPPAAPAGGPAVDDAGREAGAGAAATRGDEDGPSLGWVAAGALLVVLVAALALPRLDGGAGGPEPGAAGAPGADAPGATANGAPGGADAAPLGPTSSVDLSSMTPREAADRLFDRVIRAWEADDRAEAARFRPMALDAYERARPLDPDGHFHRAMLHLVGGEWEAVLEAARAGLAEEPDHLLSLAIAAEALTALGDTARALEHHERFLRSWDAEMASDREDYESHRRLLDGMRRSALEATGADEDAGAADG